jgi:hypothetical protein
LSRFSISGTPDDRHPISEIYHFYVKKITDSGYSPKTHNFLKKQKELRDGEACSHQ